jgi:two-component system chemotaxis response regulator CheY
MHKILIIDESTLMRMRIIRVLHENGYKNTVDYSNANMVFMSMKTYLQDVDLVITEMDLQGVGGLELIKKIKNTPEYCKIPIILMSSKNDVKTINNAIKSGAVDFVVKPFEDGRVIDKVRRIVSKSMPRACQRNLNEEIKKVETLVSLEYERAMRGDNPVSFIRFKTSEGNGDDIINKTKNVLRKIDSVEPVGDEILVVLPLADENGLKVVFDKLEKHLNSFQIIVKENELALFLPDTSKKLEDLLDKLLYIYRKSMIDKANN